VTNVKKRLLALIKAKPSVLGNQNDLISSYWVVFDNVTGLQDLPAATKAETIIREYRSLSDSGALSVHRPRKDSREKERTFQHEFEPLL
jgi:hypothetical protein